MKTIHIKILSCIVTVCLAALMFTGCKKLGGLDLQENTEHETTTLDPRVNMSAWDYLKTRALGTSAFKDSIFYLMYQGILYSEIDTMEYTKPGRTFIFLHRDAVLRRTNNITQTDSYFGRYKVGAAPGVPATSWDQYPKLQVKNYLLSLIAMGEHSFENITPDPKFVKTLMPLGYDPLNPESLIAFKVLNDRDSRLRINDFPGSEFPAANLAIPGLQARTAGLISTNGPIHVVDRVVFFQRR